jgi:hypothetical protein
VPLIVLSCTMPSNGDKCRCGSIIDQYCNHCLGCKVNHKAKAGNGIRDEITKVFQCILLVVSMIESPTQVECRVHNVVPSLPSLKPFNLSIRLDHSLETGQWRVPYTRIGFDVTLIQSTNPSCSTPSEVAQYNETDLLLRDGEKMKFARRLGGTNPITKLTLIADEVIGKILDSNNVFIPIAVGPLDELGTRSVVSLKMVECYRCPHSPKTVDVRSTLSKNALLAVA